MKSEDVRKQPGKQTNKNVLLFGFVFALGKSTLTPLARVDGNNNYVVVSHRLSFHASVCHDRHDHTTFACASAEQNQPKDVVEGGGGKSILCLILTASLVDTF